jgi:hypothetical protein
LYAATALLCFALYINSQPLVDEQEFLEKFPFIDNLNREVVIENFANQLSMVRIQEAHENFLKVDSNSRNTCKEEKEIKNTINECTCNSTVIGKKRSHIVDDNPHMRYQK